MRLLIAVSAIALAACSGADAREGDHARTDQRGDSRSYQVGEFDAVSLGGQHNVIVRVGPAASVRAEGAAEDLDRLEIVGERGELKIRNKRRGEWRMDWSGSPVTVYVTTPRLRAASIAGSGDMRIDRVDSERFNGSVAGSGDLEIAGLAVRDADFSIAGSGNIRAAGAAARQTISIAGSGDVDAPGLDSRTLDVKIMGSGGVRARATEHANVNIMGSGDVQLQGGAECSVRKAGSGSVRCG